MQIFVFENHQGEWNCCFGDGCNRSLHRISRQKWNHKHLGHFTFWVQLNMFRLMSSALSQIFLFHREFTHPIRTIYNACNDRGLSKVALSTDGRSVIVASEGKGSFLKLWQWSFGTENEDSKGLKCFKYESVGAVHSTTINVCFPSFLSLRHFKASWKVRRSEKHQI